METDWWRSFFSGNWLDVQRNVRSGRTSQEVEFLQRNLHLTAGCRVLDVPCGNGRLAIPLAERGCRVTGVDITATLLQEAQFVSQEANLDLELVETDMRDLPWSERFDAAFCFWGSFGYFDDEGNKGFLEAVHRALKPGSRFALDLANIAETILPKLQPRSWSKVGETLVLEERTYRHVESRIDCEWTLVADGVSETKTTSMRVYGYRELTSLFSEVGFEVCGAFSSLDDDPYELGRRGYFIVEKRSIPHEKARL